MMRRSLTCIVAAIVACAEDSDGEHLGADTGDAGTAGGEGDASAALGEVRPGWYRVVLYEERSNTCGEAHGAAKWTDATVAIFPNSAEPGEYFFVSSADNIANEYPTIVPSQREGLDFEGAPAFERRLNSAPPPTIPEMLCSQAWQGTLAGVYDETGAADVDATLSAGPVGGTDCRQASPPPYPAVGCEQDYYVRLEFWRPWEPISGGGDD